MVDPGVLVCSGLIFRFSGFGVAGLESSLREASVCSESVVEGEGLFAGTVLFM